MIASKLHVIQDFTDTRELAKQAWALAQEAMSIALNPDPRYTGKECTILYCKGMIQAYSNVAHSLEKMGSGVQSRDFWQAIDYTTIALTLLSSAWGWSERGSLSTVLANLEANV